MIMKAKKFVLSVTWRLREASGVILVQIPRPKNPGRLEDIRRWMSSSSRESKFALLLSFLFSSSHVY